MLIGQAYEEIDNQVEGVEETKDDSLKILRFERFKKRIESIHKDDYVDSMILK